MELVRDDPNAFLPKGISIGGFTIYFYALCILFGMIIAIILGLREAKKLGIKTDDIFNGAVIGIILGIIGARIYYVIFAWKEYSSHPIDVFAIWEGGLAIHGGIIVGFVFAFFYCRKKKISILAVFDMLVIGFLIGQTCGRWGNFFNQEAHGGITSLEFLKSIGIPPFIYKQMYIYEDGAYNYFHPTFFYESLWNFIAIIALLILRRTRTLRLGDQAGIYLIWYGIGRLWIEGMRTDSLMIGNIKQNQLISIVLIILGIVYLVFKYVKIKPDYYIYYLEPEIEPVMNKKMIKEIENVIIIKPVIEEATNEEVVEEKKEEITYEVPTELDSNAPFRKSKYIVDDDEGDE